VSISLIG